MKPLMLLRNDFFVGGNWFREFMQHRVMIGDSLRIFPSLPGTLAFSILTPTTTVLSSLQVGKAWSLTASRIGS